MSSLPTNPSAAFIRANPALYGPGLVALANSNDNNPPTQIPDTKPKRHKAPALGCTGEGKAQGIPRVVVRFVGYRVRPLDPDNFAGSVKDCLDGLRHCGLIEGDEPWRIILETEQVRVKKFEYEETVITITIP